MGVGGAIGAAMTQGVADLASGAKTAQEVFADMLKGIGDALISAAQQMIATYIAIGIAKMFAGMGGGGNPAGSGGNVLPGGWQQYAGGFGGGRASGGPVEPNTTYLVGEKGPELLEMGSSGGYVHNNEGMKSAMQRYSPAGGGRAAADDEGGKGAAGADSSANHYTLETVVINNVEYATVEQVRQMSRTAAKQGAEGGYAKTMGAMRNSRSTRSRIGLR